MREKCRESGKIIQVGYVGGERALLKMSLVEAEKKDPWKWRNPETIRAESSQETGWMGHAGWRSSRLHVALEAEARERLLQLCNNAGKVKTPEARFFGLNNKFE